MATYGDLHTLLEDDDLLQKLQMACADAALTVATGADTSAPFDQGAGKHDARLKWAASVATNSGSAAKAAMPFVLMDNKNATVEQIQNADDALIQTSMNKCVDALASPFLV